MAIKKSKKRVVIGVGYPWYGRAFTDEGRQLESHRLGAIKLYKESLSSPTNPEIVMLDPKGIGNFKKYKLILEEV